MSFQDAVNAQNNGDLKLADKIYISLRGMFHIKIIDENCPSVFG